MALKKASRFHRPRRTDPLETPRIEVRHFTTGEVARILGIPMWRLQKFLVSPRYRLSPTGQLGEGQGSRRFFRIEDVYRLGIAVALVRDGFAAKFVGAVLEQVEDDDLVGYDERGEEARTPGIALRRGRGGPELEFFSPPQLPDTKSEKPVYYTLDLNEVICRIDQRIAALTKLKQQK